MNNNEDWVDNTTETEITFIKNWIGNSIEEHDSWIKHHEFLIYGDDSFNSHLENLVEIGILKGKKDILIELQNVILKYEKNLRIKNEIIIIEE